MHSKVSTWKRITILGMILLLVVLLFIVSSTHVLVEVWWHASLNRLLYYLMRSSYQGLVALLVTLLQGSFIFFNFILIPMLLRFDPARLSNNSGLLQRLSMLMFSPSFKLFFISVILFTIPILTPIYWHWEDFLLFLFNVGSDMTDPVFGRNIAFYLLVYPLYQLLQKELLIVFSLLFATVAGAYWLARRQLNRGDKPFPLGVRIHLTLLIIVIVVIQAWSIGLERFDILYIDRHQPVYFGPGFVDLNVQLPLIWLNFVFFVASAAAAITYLHFRRGVKWMAGCAVIYLLVLAIKQTMWLPELIERFYVRPNPVTAEQRNIDYNIEATLQAFGLNGVETIDFPLNGDSEPVDSQAISEVLENIPLWDHELLLAGYDQLQAIRPFFTFYDVAVDRYRLDGHNVQVNLAARELNTENLPQAARTWNNLHFIYTHGYGLVMTPSLQRGTWPMEWLVRDLNNRTDYDPLRIERPEIFYGLADLDYAIVPNNARPPKLQNGDFQVRNDLQTNGGVPVSPLLARLVMASYFGDLDLLLTQNIGKGSRILFRRNIMERINTLAPFLTIDDHPYPVVVDGKIYWVVDAYTTSDRFPVVARYPFPLQGGDAAKSVNYVRNSVKIVVDAYSGALDLYLLDASDPVASTYRAIYPTLFKDAKDIPQAFINHLSYPSRLFALQMAVYARYHQTDPNVYYQQSEAMDFPRIDGQKVLPYFLTLPAPGNAGDKGSDDYRFLLVSPLSRIGRDNLGMLAMAGCVKAADCQSAYSADIVTYRFPLDQQIEGPAQMTGLINQDPEITRQLTLWQQRGATVIRGRMIIVPIAGNVLYIQPIYTQAKRETGFPQLSRVIVAMNRVAAMDSSLQGAYGKLKEKLGLKTRP